MLTNWHRRLPHLVRHNTRDEAAALSEPALIPSFLLCLHLFRLGWALVAAQAFLRLRRARRGCSRAGGTGLSSRSFSCFGAQALGTPLQELWPWGPRAQAR